MQKSLRKNYSLNDYHHNLWTFSFNQTLFHNQSISKFSTLPSRPSRPRPRKYQSRSSFLSPFFLFVPFVIHANATTDIIKPVKRQEITPVNNTSPSSTVAPTSSTTVTKPSIFATPTPTVPVTSPQTTDAAQSYGKTTIIAIIVVCVVLAIPLFYFAIKLYGKGLAWYKKRDTSDLPPPRPVPGMSVLTAASVGRMSVDALRSQRSSGIFAYPIPTPREAGSQRGSIHGSRTGSIVYSNTGGNQSSPMISSSNSIHSIGSHSKSPNIQSSRPSSMQDLFNRPPSSAGTINGVDWYHHRPHHVKELSMPQPLAPRTLVQSDVHNRTMQFGANSSIGISLGLDDFLNNGQKKSISENENSIKEKRRESAPLSRLTSLSGNNNDFENKNSENILNDERNFKNEEIISQVPKIKNSDNEIQKIQSLDNDLPRIQNSDNESGENSGNSSSGESRDHLRQYPQHSGYGGNGTRESFYQSRSRTSSTLGYRPPSVHLEHLLERSPSAEYLN